MLQLVADVVQAVEDRAPLLLREVERFAHLVGEEGVVADVAPQLRAAQQIGVEEERPAFGLEFHAPIVEPDALPRSEEDERPLLIVIGATAVLDIAALDIFEKYRVEPHAEPDALAERTLRKVDDADERVQRRIVHQIVILFDTIQFQYILHDRGILRPLQSYAFFRFLRDNRNNGKTIRDPYNGPEAPMRYFCSVGTEGVAGLAPEDGGTDRKNEPFR